MNPGPEAWHEAGHALAAHRLGGRVFEVTLESEREGVEGHVSVEWGRADDETEAHRQATVALAGPVAELVFQGEDVLHDPEALASWRADWETAESWLIRGHADPLARDEARHAILRELHTLFDGPAGYERLARVADALDAHVTLDDRLFLEAVEDR